MSVFGSAFGRDQHGFEVEDGRHRRGMELTDVPGALRLHLDFGKVVGQEMTVAHPVVVGGRIEQASVRLSAADGDHPSHPDLRVVGVLEGRRPSTLGHGAVAGHVDRGVHDEVGVGRVGDENGLGDAKVAPPLLPACLCLGLALCYFHGGPQRHLAGKGTKRSVKCYEKERKETTALYAVEPRASNNNITFSDVQNIIQLAIFFILNFAECFIS